MQSPVARSRVTGRVRDALRLPQVEPDPSRVAVLLNGNARKVSDKLAREVEHIVGADHVYYSRSLDDAEAFARRIVQQGYGTVVCGGGDGTLVNTVNMVQRYIIESNQWRLERFRRHGELQHMLGTPRFAFLRLGTGNGMTSVVGAGDPLNDLRRIVDFVPTRLQRLPLIDDGFDRFFFCGMGYDSLLLDDYNALKKRAHNPVLKLLMQNVGGYLAAFFGRTLPSLLWGRAGTLEARVINRGRAFAVDPRRGDAVEEIATGETLFEGRATFIGAGTMPFYGYNFKIFPFACMMPGMMQLRVANLRPLEGVRHLRSIWRGTYRQPDKLFDFLVESVDVELAKPYPFQHSGDSQGPRDRLSLRLAETPLTLVDLHAPRSSN